MLSIIAKFAVIILGAVFVTAAHTYPKQNLLLEHDEQVDAQTQESAGGQLGQPGTSEGAQSEQLSVDEKASPSNNEPASTSEPTAVPAPLAASPSASPSATASASPSASPVPSATATPSQSPVASPSSQPDASPSLN